MATIRMHHKQMGATIRSSIKSNRHALDAGFMKVLATVKGELAKASPVGATAMYRGAWQVEGELSKRTLRIVNRAPYAGVIERGARPHPVNAAGVASIREWVHLGPMFLPPGPEADRVVWAIVNKIKTEGQKGQFILKKMLPKIERWLDQRLRRDLDAAYEGRQR